MKRRSDTSDYLLVNVLYEDGSQRSNRKIMASQLSGFDDEADIRQAIDEQDRKIAEMSGQPRAAVKTITRVKQ
jgi:hypothetical protein